MELAAAVAEAFFHYPQADVQWSPGLIITKCYCMDVAAFAKLWYGRHVVVALEAGLIAVTGYRHDFSICDASICP